MPRTSVVAAAKLISTFDAQLLIKRAYQLLIKRAYHKHVCLHAASEESEEQGGGQRGSMRRGGGAGPGGVSSSSSFHCPREHPPPPPDSTRTNTIPFISVNLVLPLPRPGPFLPCKACAIALEAAPEAAVAAEHRRQRLSLPDLLLDRLPDLPLSQRLGFGVQVEGFRALAFKVWGGVRFRVLEFGRGCLPDLPRRLVQQVGHVPLPARTCRPPHAVQVYHLHHEPASVCSSAVRPPAAPASKLQAQRTGSTTHRNTTHSVATKRS